MTQMAKGRKRGRSGARRLDLGSLGDLLKDGRVWTAVGVVTQPDGEDTWYAIEDGDLWVEVELVPSRLDLTCRWGVAGGGAGLGIWTVPPVGTEVAVLVPDGEVDFMPTIVGCMSTGSLPNGVAENVIVIAASSKVLIHDGAGGALPLPTLAEFNQHTHPTGTGPSGVPTQQAVGTTVLEAK